MSPLFLLLLLGLSLAVVAFDSSDTDEDDEQVVDDEIIEGTDGPDTLTAGRDQTTNGLGGDDTLEAAGDNAKLNGGLGDDTLISIENDNVLIDGGEGDDKITFQPASQNGTDTGRALSGLGADTISVLAGVVMWTAARATTSSTPKDRSQAFQVAMATTQSQATLRIMAVAPHCRVMLVTICLF